MKAVTELEKRGCDTWGCGHFGASRGERTHKGIDFKCPPGVQVLSPVKGRVTKLGYCYRDTPVFRYVQITTEDFKDYRVFYCEPVVPEGREVTEETVIGVAQDLGERYPGITPHIHMEVKYKGEYLDPEEEDV